MQPPQTLRAPKNPQFNLSHPSHPPDNNNAPAALYSHRGGELKTELYRRTENVEGICRKWGRPHIPVSRGGRNQKRAVGPVDAGRGEMGQGGEQPVLLDGVSLLPVTGCHFPVVQIREAFRRSLRSRDRGPKNTKETNQWPRHPGGWNVLAVGVLGQSHPLEKIPQSTGITPPKTPIIRPKRAVLGPKKISQNSNNNC